MMNEGKADKRCGGCNVLEPDDGRLLACVHIICLACLNDGITTRGDVECALCKVTTKPTIGALPLSQQLPSSKSLLYANAADAAPDPKKKTFCDFCAGDDPPLATHICRDCENAGLCSIHAEQHLQKKPFRAHAVVEVGSMWSMSGMTTADIPVAMCPLHRKHIAVTFCHDCRHIMCDACVFKGHTNHNTVVLSAAALECREELRQAVDTLVAEQLADSDRAEGASAASEVAAANVPATTFPGKYDDALQQANVDLLQLEKDAADASALVAEIFAKVRADVDKAEKAILADLDKVFWEKQSALLRHQHHLHLLQSQNQLSLELGVALLEPTASDSDVVLLANPVMSRLQQFHADLEERTMDVNAKRLHAVVMSDTLSSLGTKMSMLMALCDGSAEESTFRVPEPVRMPTALQSTARRVCSREQPQLEPRPVASPPAMFQQRLANDPLAGVRSVPDDEPESAFSRHAAFCQEPSFSPQPPLSPSSSGYTPQPAHNPTMTYHPPTPAHHYILERHANESDHDHPVSCLSDDRRCTNSSYSAGRAFSKSTPTQQNSILDDIDDTDFGFSAPRPAVPSTQPGGRLFANDSDDDYDNLF